MLRQQSIHLAIKRSISTHLLRQQKGGEGSFFSRPGPASEALAGHTMGAWLAFARGGCPSHPGIGTWPAYDVGRRATMILGRECRVVDAPLDEERRAWEGLI